MPPKKATACSQSGSQDTWLNKDTTPQETQGMLQETPWDENTSIQETPQEAIGETPHDKGSSTAPPQHAEGMEYQPPPEPLTQDKLFQLLMGLQSQNQINEQVITIANQDKSKLSSPPKSKLYKEDNYQAYYNFCY